MVAVGNKKKKLTTNWDSNEKLSRITEHKNTQPLNLESIVFDALDHTEDVKS